MWLVQRIAILELEKSSRDLIARVSKTNIYIYIQEEKWYFSINRVIIFFL
jgi:hypothetical protein